MTWEALTPATAVYGLMAVGVAVFFIKFAIDARKWAKEDAAEQQHWIEDL